MGAVTVASVVITALVYVVLGAVSLPYGINNYIGIIP